MTDRVSLEVSDNIAVGRLDPMNLIDIYKRLDLTRADALILSSCVQMPSLPAIALVEKECGLPVVTAAACTMWAMLTRLGLKTYVPGAGALLKGDL